MKNRTEWFKEAGYGLFVHYTTFTLSEDATSEYKRENWEKRFEDYKRAIDSFDVDTFTNQVIESGAKFLFFTTSHADLMLPFPLKELDEIVEGHTCKRDLIGEISDKLAKHNIKLLLYFNGDGSTDPMWQKKTCFKENPQLHAEYCYRVTEAISKKYGSKIAGWWIDCCYESDVCGGTGLRYDYKRYAKALRAGNENSIVAFNFRGTCCWGSKWGIDIADFQAGEENALEFLPEGRFSGESGLQWFGLCWMDDFWVHEKIGEPKPRYKTQEVLDYIRRVKEGEGVFAYNTAPYKNGHIAPQPMAQLREIKANL